jgi:hypothetical protein
MPKESEENTGRRAGRPQEGHTARRERGDQKVDIFFSLSSPCFLGYSEKNV